MKRGAQKERKFSIGQTFVRSQITTLLLSLILYSGGSCGKGWTEFGDRCIRFVSSNMTFVDAENVCRSEGGTLLMLNYLQEEKDLLTHGLSASQYIIYYYPSAKEISLFIPQASKQPNK